MHSEVKVFPRSNGEIQRVHLVRFDDWSQLDFFSPAPSAKALDCFSSIYRQYLIPACPWIFGSLVLFRLPQGLPVPFPFLSEKYGAVSDPLTAATIALKEGLRVIGKKITFRSKQVQQFCEALQAQNCLQIVQGKLPITTIIPVDNASGFLTQAEPCAPLKVNSSFFIMDPFDCATVHDHVGTPFGLCVTDGHILRPPLFMREALLVRDNGQVSIEAPDIRKIPVEIAGKRYMHEQNAIIYSRPERAKTPSGKGVRIVIVGRHVVAVRSGGRVSIPASGFVLCPEEPVCVNPGDAVIYHAMEDVRFAIQAGNSIIRNGEQTLCFRSRFYNIRHLERVPFPPCLYPLDFDHAKAARIALGADKSGKPMLLWAEGAAKHGHIPGFDSCGASLLDMAQICKDLGMVNAINLDGGGSAQMLLNNKRHLMISDRNAADNLESERPVPAGLIVR